ncbi:MAG: hypothetical protein L6Q26_03460 [Anaerolineales bacterium]|nr:hypothetical protein [Anaerolineales bacterium]
MRNFLALVCVLSLALTGCSTATLTPIPPTPASNLITVTGTAQTDKILPVVPATPAASNAELVTASPTPDLRLLPERWKEWPVLPSVSERAREIYQRGLAMGNNPRSFSKIGDCQSVPASFLGIYDRPGEYSFLEGHQSLQETIDVYSGLFGREGEAVRGGFNTATVLSPLWANNQVCLPGENPIECENRVNNPSIAFVSLEVWFSGRTPEVYEKYLRRIIEYNIEQGVVPILGTKADNVEGDHSINYTIAKLAYEYDVPLWNFWLAVQSAPSHGLDPTDENGFHLNVEGWNIRSYTALQALDKVRRELEGMPVAQPSDQQTSGPEDVVQPTFAPGPITSLPYSTVETKPAASASSILFDIAIRENGILQSTGIFHGALNGQTWKALAETGSTLLDYSSKGILASQSNNLYFIMDTERSLLTDQLPLDSPQSAVWMNDGRVAFISQTGNQKQVVLLDPSGGEPIHIIPTGNPPVELYPSHDSSLIWGTGPCENGSCAVRELTITNADGSMVNTLAVTGKPAVFSSDRIAFANQDENNNNLLTLIHGDSSSRFPISGNRVLGMSWSPDGETLAVVTAKVSDYSGRTLSSALHLVTPPYTVNLAFQVESEEIEPPVWSPDGKQVLLIRRPQSGGGLNVVFSLLDVATEFLVNDGEKYLVTRRIFWLP